MTRLTSAIVGLAAVVSFLLGVVVATTRPERARSVLPARPGVDAAAPFSGATPTEASTRPTAPAAGLVDFAEVAAGLNRAVVKVDAASRGSEERPRGAQRWRFGDDPSAPREGSGSGFIIEASGYILTNYHVIEGVDRVTVTLGDGRTFRATVVGIDPALDVALLKIPAREPLPVAPLGDSSTLRVGEWVCAIGNPLGVRALRHGRRRQLPGPQGLRPEPRRATSRRTPGSRSATAAGRSSTRAARSSGSRRPSARRRPTSASPSPSARSSPCCRR